MRRRWPWLVLIGAFGIGAWLAPKFISLPITVSEGFDPYGHPMGHPVSKIVRDDQPPFRVELGKPWRIEFGRGSGWHGLDTVKLDQDGSLVLHRAQDRQGNSWETAVAQLPPDAVAKVLQAVESNRLLELDKAYHADVHDGEQWVLWVQQGEREKAVYFNNHFPVAIVMFAEQLDAVLSGSVGPGLQWRAVPSARSRDHQKALWASLNR